MNDAQLCITAISFTREWSILGGPGDPDGMRKHALLSPYAVMKKPLSLEDHQTSKMIVPACALDRCRRNRYERSMHLALKSDDCGAQRCCANGIHGRP